MYVSKPFTDLPSFPIKHKLQYHDMSRFNFQIINGPQVAIQLRAVVTTPDLHISCNLVEFGEVKCGECKIISLQMYNYQAVRCDWTYTPCEKEKCQVNEQIREFYRC